MVLSWPTELEASNQPKKRSVRLTLQSGHPWLGAGRTEQIIETPAAELWGEHRHLVRSAVTPARACRWVDGATAALDPNNPRAALTRIGRAFLALMRSPDVVNKHRTLYGAQGLDTAAAESFFAAGPKRLVDAVAAYLRAAQRAGSLRAPDAEMAANQYLSLFLGLGQVRALLGLTLPTKREDAALLSANVALFLRALGKRSPT